MTPSTLDVLNMLALFALTYVGGYLAGRGRKQPNVVIYIEKPKEPQP
jgi:hypothetical protein